MTKLITIEKVKQQVRDTKQVRFELVALRNWLTYEEPHNAKNMLAALDHVYSVLEDSQKTLEATSSVLADDMRLESVSKAFRKPNSIPVVSALVCR